ncbi:hypothetical protein [Brachyspira sp.]|uniref:hypothetical protein n=1 Tax=Brachyspira sp. TaxID=1977261 RepID=UPI002637599D|nr:hypothetical protein [Brachyspira sp.]
MDDSLLKKIVLEVINQLNKTSCIDSVFVLSKNNNFNFKNELENIGYHLNISSTFDNININDYSIIIIDDLSVEILSCICSLVYKDKNISFLIDALLCGKKVIALKDNSKFNNYKNNASNQLFNKVLELEKIAESYGLVILDNDNFISYFNKNSNIISTGNYFDFTDKKVISKCDIMDIINHYSSIKVRNNVIITPLVMDYIKENKINILYE